MLSDVKVYGSLKLLRVLSRDKCREVQDLMKLSVVFPSWLQIASKVEVWGRITLLEIRPWKEVLETEGEEVKPHVCGGNCLEAKQGKACLFMWHASYTMAIQSGFHN